MSSDNSKLERYEDRYPLCKEYVYALERLLTEILLKEKLKIHSVNGRAKSPDSFYKKSIKTIALDNNPNNELKYNNPLEQITDQSGIRIIVLLPRDVEKVNDIIEKEFNVIEQITHGDKFGYQSTHFIVNMNKLRLTLSEYQKFTNLKAEIQVRTILQHAWAEIEYDIIYKSSIVMPTQTQHNLASLAGLLEIADKEFQRIQEEDDSQRIKTKQNIKEGILEDAEITPDALHTFLDNHLGPDARMSNYSYDWITRLLRKLGFVDFNQVNECINEYDDATLSYIANGTRQGQINRFQYMLLASMGNNFIERHLWQDEWWINLNNKLLKKFESAEIKIGSYLPNLLDVALPS